MKTTTSPTLYQCGTLRYTLGGLALAFIWFLLGAFCYSLTVAIVPALVPLKLKALHAADWQISTIMTAIGGIFNMTICPMVSFKSDRYRSKWGRRIPFILKTLPFFCLALALFAFGDEISAFVQKNVGLLAGIAPTTITIGVILVIMALYQFFFMFVGSVLWYIPNDITPPQFLARMNGLFSIVNTAAAAIFNYFIFRHAETHYREIMLGGAVVYAIGVGIMCFMLKEGEYPPLSEEDKRQSNGIAGVITFLKESFSHKFYWLRFGITAMTAISGLIYVFGIFLSQEMGMSLTDIGNFNFVNGIASLIIAAILTYFAAIFIDSWHPVRITLYGAFFVSCSMLVGCKYLFLTFPVGVYFYSTLAVGMIGALLGAMLGTALCPAEMLMFPKSRYGQFCSAQALLRSASTTIFGVIAGLFLDGVKYFFPETPNYAYRFGFLWEFGWTIPILIMSYYMYREWQALGGARGFKAPAPWSPGKFESMPIAKTIGPRLKCLQITFWLFDLNLLLSLAGAGFMAYWAYRNGAGADGRYLLWAAVPAATVTYLIWQWVRRGIMADIRASRAGRPLRNGIPHHGILLIVAIKHLLLFGICLYQACAAVFYQMDKGATIVWLNEILINLTLIGAIYIICRMERGYSTELEPE